MLFVKGKHSHIGADRTNSILLQVKEIIIRQGLVHARVEVDEVGVGSSLGTVSSKVANFSALEASIIGVVQLAVTCDISAIPLPLMLESSPLELPPLLAPWWCSSPA